MATEKKSKDAIKESVERHTCTMEPYTHPNQRIDGNEVPIVATFSCNGCNHQVLSACSQQNDEQAVLVPCKLNTCKVPDYL